MSGGVKKRKGVVSKRMKSTRDTLEKSTSKRSPFNLNIQKKVKAMLQLRQAAVRNRQSAIIHGEDNGGSMSVDSENVGSDVIESSDQMLRIGRVVEPSKFVSGYTNETLILDISLDRIGTLLGLTNSVRFIAEKHLKKTRLVFIKYMRALLDDDKSVNCWKKFLVLPTVLFGGYLGENNLKVEYGLRLELLLVDDWSSFTLGKFLKRENTGLKTLEKVVDKNKRGNCRVTNMVHVGEYSRAMAIACSDGRSVLPSENVFNKLQNKHPQRNSYIGMTDDFKKSVLEYKVSDEDEIFVTWTTVREIVQHLHKFVKHGPDKLRNEHLQALCGRTKEPISEELEFCEHFASIINIIVNGRCPIEVSAALRDAEMFAGPKGNDDVRPIDIGGTLRKIAGKVCFNKTKRFNDKHFGTLQYALQSGGTEKIIHSFQMAMQGTPEKDFFAIDAVNAFNSGNRLIGLREIFVHFKEVLPFMLTMYANDPKCWYYGLEDEIKPILAEEGFTQGDVMATWAFIMTIQPFLLGLREVLGEGNFTKFFVDDGNICADFETMILAIEYILEHGPKYGYHMSLSKGSYLLGKCGDVNLAVERKNVLIEKFHLVESIIHIHPDDVDDNDKFVTALEYGMLMLGAPVGTNEFVKHKLELHGGDLIKVSENLMGVENLQSRFLLLKYCFCPKINHILRTVRPSLTVGLVEQFEFLKKKIFCSILAEKSDFLSDLKWEQCGFAICDGGMGLGNMWAVQECAFASSIIACYHSSLNEEFGIARLLQLHENNGDSDILNLEEFHNIYKKFHLLKPDVFSNLECFLQIGVEKQETVQSILTGFVMQKNLAAFKCKLVGQLSIEGAFFTSLQNDNGGRWLTVVPKSDEFRFHNNSYETSIRYRLFLPMRKLAEGTICDGCRKKVVLDRTGHHLVTGCPCFGKRTQQHDAIAHCLSGLISYSGMRNVREELGCFRDADPENGKKPDITVINPMLSATNDSELNLVNGDGRIPKLILDVQITSPLKGSQSGVFERMTPYMASKVNNMADKAFNSKMHKYKKIAEDNGLSFLPIIFETTGRVHPKAEKFVEALAEFASEEKKIEKGTIFAFMMNKLSSVLQKHLAESINSRVSTINGHLTRSATRQFSHSHEFVSSHERYRSRGHGFG